MQASAARAHRINQENTRGNKQSMPPVDSTKPDAYQTILNSSLPPQEKEVNRVAQEILTLLVGGSSSTSRLMTSMTFHLASEPTILARLREEIKLAMPDQSVMPDLEQLESLPYLVSAQSLDNYANFLIVFKDKDKALMVSTDGCYQGVTPHLYSRHVAPALSFTGKATYIRRLDNPF